MLNFTSDYYVAILWHLAVVYVAFAVWLEVVANLAIKFGRNMEWTLLVRIASVISENKQVAYQNMYITYEVAIYWFIVKIFANIEKASPILLFLVSLHLLFIVVSKIHFYFTFDQLSRAYPQFTHSMVV
jgi:hypothetical protein